MKESELKIIHLMAFLEKREVPSSVLQLVYSTPFAPELLFDVMLECYRLGEDFGAKKLNPYAEKDQEGSVRDFLSIISKLKAC